MADDADVANIAAQILLDAKIAARKPDPVGDPSTWIAGECERCEEYKPRLVRGYCAVCRDKYKLD